MTKYWTRWVMATSALAAAVLLDEWVQTYTSALTLRLALVAGLALIAVRLSTNNAASPADAQPPSEQGELKVSVPSPDREMMTEISTALEHLRRVGLLLEISETHRQPLPRVVPINLKLVIKHLEKARQQLGGREQQSASVFAQRLPVEGSPPFAASD